MSEPPHSAPTWLDRPFAELMRLALPTTVSMLSYSLMTVVDTIVVGRLGKAELAGVGLGGTWAFTLIAFGWGLARGGKTLVAQAMGASRRDEVGGYLGASLVGSVAFGLVALAAAWPVGWLLARQSSTAAQGHFFFQYLLIRSIGSPIALAANALKEVRYGVGDARAPTIATIVANVANAVLAYVLVYPLGLGVAGAAWATVIAQLIEVGVLALYQTRAGWGTRAMTRAHVAAVMRLGVPTGLQMLLEVGAFAVLAAMISSMSEAQMAGHQITLQLISFSFLPAFAIGESASIMVGQAIGAGREDMVLRLSTLALRAVAVYTASCTLVLATLATIIVRPFSADVEAQTVATLLVRTSTLFLVADGANIVGRSVLRGAGDVRFPAWVGVTCSWMLTPPLAWLLGFHFHLNAFGGWLGLSAEVFLGAVIQWARLVRGGWRPHAARVRADVIALADAEH